MLEILEDDVEDSAATHARKVAPLKGLIRATEPRYEAQWDEQPPGYQVSMTAGIVGFGIAIVKLEGKFKLSQNRPEIDRRTIKQAHSEGTPDQRELAGWMRRLEV